MSEKLKNSNVCVRHFAVPNSISVAVNTETLSEETLNLSEPVTSSPPNQVKANKTNPSKVNPLIPVRRSF